MSQRSLPARLRLAATLAVLTGLALGCSSSHKAIKTTTPPAPAAATATTITPATTPATTDTTATTQAPTGANLSGTWNGSYNGALNGSFTLTWQQSGNQLNGSIKITDPASILSISGTVSGSSIQFGAVGGATYQGTVSGSSMSGSWQLAGGPGGGGSWNASKS